jgi:hypothetical protein
MAELTTGAAKEAAAPTSRAPQEQSLDSLLGLLVDQLRSGEWIAQQQVKAVAEGAVNVFELAAAQSAECSVSEPPAPTSVPSDTSVAAEPSGS